MGHNGKTAKRSEPKQSNLKKKGYTKQDIHDKNSNVCLLEKGNVDLCECTQHDWMLLPKPLVVDLGEGEATTRGVLHDGRRDQCLQRRAETGGRVHLGWHTLPHDDVPGSKSQRSTWVREVDGAT